MHENERLAYIMQRVSQDETLNVQLLADEIGIPVETILKDIATLEESQLIAKGKIKKESVDQCRESKQIVYNTLNVLDRAKENDIAKDNVAKRACELIDDGDCVFIDSGSSTMFMAKYLIDKKITIVTNSQLLVHELLDFKGEMIVLGGRYRISCDMTVGNTTVEEMKKFNFDKAFISAVGVDVKKDCVYCVEDEVGEVKIAAMANSNRSYLLLDQSKFRKRAAYSFSRLERFDKVLVDAYPDDLELFKNLELI